MTESGKILFGTCSWNYESWTGLVYSLPKRTRWFPKSALSCSSSNISPYREFGPPPADTAVVRLLGGDRGATEKLTGERWDRIVLEKSDKNLATDDPGSGGPGS